MERIPTFQESDHREREPRQRRVYEHVLQVEGAEIPSGRFAFAVHKGGRENEENQDRIVIDPEQGLYVVVDGMGGPGGGKRAAEIVAEEIPKGFAVGLLPKDMQRKAHERMHGEEGIPEGGGAAYAAFSLDGDTPRFWNAGDVEA